MFTDCSDRHIFQLNFHLIQSKKCLFLSVSWQTKIFKKKICYKVFREDYVQLINIKKNTKKKNKHRDGDDATKIASKSHSTI